jgi:hypothetical protein
VSITNYAVGLTFTASAYLIAIDRFGSRGSDPKDSANLLVLAIHGCHITPAIGLGDPTIHVGGIDLDMYDTVKKELVWE